MNKNEVLKVAERIAMVNSIYDIKISNEAIFYQATLLQDLDFNNVIFAIDKFIQTNKTNRPPSPAHIREIISPQISSRELAVSTARAIDKAISKYGYVWAWGERINGETYFKGGGRYHWTFKEAVVAELGEVAWHAICSKGSWEQLRNSANEMDEGTFIAQMRDQIESTINLKKNGVDITKVELPSSGNNNEYDPKVTSMINYRKMPNEV